MKYWSYKKAKLDYRKPVPRPVTRMTIAIFAAIAAISIFAIGWAGDYRACERDNYFVPYFNTEAKVLTDQVARDKVRIKVAHGISLKEDLVAIKEDTFAAKKLRIKPLVCAGVLPPIPKEGVS